jgi:hypothetical protein
MKNLERYKIDLENLLQIGSSMDEDLNFQNLTKEERAKLSNKSKEELKKTVGTFNSIYQEWYTESISLIRQLIPDRLNEFILLYQVDSKRKEINTITYSIQDWLVGIRAANNSYTGKKYFDDSATIAMKFKTQLQILKSAKKRFESSLFDIKQLIQADLFDSEIETAKELNKKGFIRAAGIICGVILEKHLDQVCQNHKIAVHKKNPAISDLNEQLKNNESIDVATWRFIQHLGDLRNKCGHNKSEEPTTNEVNDLINGTEKIIKTIY